MKIALSTIGKFHTFDLARELHNRGLLAGLATGYPRFKLKNEGIPENMIQTFPWVQAPYMGFPWKNRLPKSVIQEWENISALTFSAWIGRNLPHCDLYVGLSGSTVSAGRTAHRHGGRYICDRGSAHIRVQDQLLRDEYMLWDVPYFGIDPRAIAREEEEYCEADCITVPSNFAMRSFLEQGVATEKVRLLPYGVNLSRFQPVDKPVNGQFDVLFVGGMSLQKGVQYLVQAYKKVVHPKKSLTFVGAFNQDLITVLKSRGVWPADARVVGHMPQAELKNMMSRSHVMVLPSIQEGFGMVMAQSMACGCPVISSKNTGGDDLFTDGQEGYIVPIRDVGALAQSMQQLADDPVKNTEMGQLALARVRGLGGWRDYGDKAVEIYNGVLQA